MMNGNQINSLQMRIANLMEDFSYEMNEETKKTFSAVADMTTNEAVEYMAKFVCTNGTGGCIHFACLLNCLYPDMTLAFVPHTDETTGAVSSKFINIVEDKYVVDFTTPLEELKSPSIITLLHSYIVIPIDKYMNQHLKIGETLTVLPNPAKQKNVPFMYYCFNNPKSIVYTRDLK